MIRKSPQSFGYVNLVTPNVDSVPMFNPLPGTPCAPLIGQYKGRGTGFPVSPPALTAHLPVNEALAFFPKDIRQMANDLFQSGTRIGVSLHIFQDVHPFNLSPNKSPEDRNIAVHPWVFPKAEGRKIEDEQVLMGLFEPFGIACDSKNTEQNIPISKFGKQRVYLHPGENNTMCLSPDEVRFMIPKGTKCSHFYLACQTKERFLASFVVIVPPDFKTVEYETLRNTLDQPGCTLQNYLDKISKSPIDEDLKGKLIRLLSL